MESSETGSQGQACVVCKRFQPQDGKLLTCLHAVCVACLQDCVCSDGWIVCAVCPVRTLCSHRGIDLGKQLPDARPLLYPHSDFGKTEDGNHSQPAEGRDAKTTLCVVCLDNDEEMEGNYCCGHCDRGPLCQSHAEKHTKKRSCHDHQIHRVFEQYPDENSQCLYHPRYYVISFCQTCRRCICSKCLGGEEHDDHTLESIPSAAQRHRTLLYQTKSSHNGSTSNFIDHADEALAVKQKLADNRRSIEQVEAEGVRSSQVVTEVYDAVHLMATEARRKALESLQQTTERQLKKLHDLQQDLETKLEQRQIAVNVASRLMAHDCADILVIQAANVTRELLSTSLPPSSSVADSGYQQYIAARRGFTNEIADCVSNGVSTHVPYLPSCILEVPDEVIAGRQGEATLQLYNFDGMPIPSGRNDMRYVSDVTASICKPSGNWSDLTVELETPRGSQLVLKVPILVTSTGVHTLVMRLYGTSKSTKFLTTTYRMRCSYYGYKFPDL